MTMSYHGGDAVSARARHGDASAAVGRVGPVRVRKGGAVDVGW